VKGLNSFLHQFEQYTAMIVTEYCNGDAGSEETKEPKQTSEPKPVPSLLVGYEHDWLSISPHAVRYWVSQLSA